MPWVKFSCHQNEENGLKIETVGEMVTHSDIRSFDTLIENGSQHLKCPEYYLFTKLYNCKRHNDEKPLMKARCPGKVGA